MSTASTDQSTVNSFYLAFYGRPADPQGLKFWTEQLSKAGGDLEAIKSAFASSEEAKVRFGTDTAEARITEIYQQLFNRDPEAEGLAYWTGAIAKGHATLADVAIAVLGGAQGSDSTLSTLRRDAAASFTAKVEASGSAYTGYAAVEAARLLVRGVTLSASDSDIDALVAATTVLTEVASEAPDVIEALGEGSALLELFDTGPGEEDPVGMLETLAVTARAAADSPNSVASLMRGGGMPQLLKAMPEGFTLKDLVATLGKGGLKAALDLTFGRSGPGKGKPGETETAAMSLEYHLGDDPAALTLENSEGSVTGMDSPVGFALEDIGSGTPQAATVDYTVNGSELSFAAPLAAGLYRMSWKEDTFTTETGHVAAGSVEFAGGHDGVFVQEGFAIDEVTTVTADVTRAATDATNEAFIDGGQASARIATGGGQDVVVDNGGTLSIVYGAIDGASADLILGFDAGNDTIVLEGEAASAIDDNADGKIGWTSVSAGNTAVDSAAEAVSVTVGAAVAVGSATGLEQTLQTLNGALNVSNIGLNDELLILATADNGTGAALFQYINKDDNGTIDDGELAPIALFGDGAAGQQDIVLVGTGSVTAP